MESVARPLQREGDSLHSAGKGNYNILVCLNITTRGEGGNMDEGHRIGGNVCKLIRGC